MVLNRGAFIVFEGCDRTGKSTQSSKLVKKLTELGHSAELIQFPNRTTATGQIIDKYLSQSEDIPDQTIHLLFSANRWESCRNIEKFLRSGVTLVCDRYSYSGVAYSAAKPGMDFNWCLNPEKGLIKPDLVFFMQLDLDSAKQRQNFGSERYEKLEFQTEVNKIYASLADESFWKIIEANQSIENIHSKVLEDTLQVIEKVSQTDFKYL